MLTLGNCTFLYYIYLHIYIFTLTLAGPNNICGEQLSKCNIKTVHLISINLILSHWCCSVSSQQQAQTVWIRCFLEKSRGVERRKFAPSFSFFLMMAQYVGISPNQSNFDSKTLPHCDAALMSLHSLHFFRAKGRGVWVKKNKYTLCLTLARGRTHAVVSASEGQGL